MGPSLGIFLLTCEKEFRYIVGKMFIRSILLSALCARTNSHKYSENTIKLIHALQMLRNINRIENVLCRIYGSSTQTHEIFSMRYGLRG